MFKVQEPYVWIITETHHYGEIDTVIYTTLSQGRAEQELKHLEENVKRCPQCGDIEATYYLKKMPLT